MTLTGFARSLGLILYYGFICRPKRQPSIHVEWFDLSKLEGFDMAPTPVARIEMDTETPRIFGITGVTGNGKLHPLEGIVFASGDADKIVLKQHPRFPQLVRITPQGVAGSASIRVTADGRIGDGVVPLDKSIGVTIADVDAADVMLFTDTDFPPLDSFDEVVEPPVVEPPVETTPPVTEPAPVEGVISGTSGAVDAPPPEATTARQVDGDNSN